MNLEFWIDLNLPPALAKWLQHDFNVKAFGFKELGFEFLDDAAVFKIASKSIETVIITTKDIDFINFANDIKNPPKILYINIGNINNKQLREIVTSNFNEVIRIFSETNQTIIEINNL